MLLPQYPKIDIDPALLERLIAVANDAADAASVHSSANFRSQLDIENKKKNGGFDPVTIADKESELAIKKVIQQAFPDHGFFGEEYGHEPSGQKPDESTNANKPLWVVDPIDGTRAYITGLPLWGTLIAVYDGNDAVLGVLEQPILRERFIGTNLVCGGTTQRASELVTPSGRRSLTTRSTQSLEQAIAQTTTPDMFDEEQSARVLASLKESVSMVRYGGDCYCYALLAMGFIDVVIERLLQPYDIAALIPIIQGAGGVVTDWSGGSAVSGGEVVASANEVIHEQVLKLIN